MDQNKTVQALQAQLAELQRNLAAQSKMIVNLSANHHHNPPNSDQSGHKSSEWLLSYTQRHGQ
ncbi:hypothetical protein PCANC_21687 [Puccinia coronata f. sp. avenae]|uniref:Uncharacterized protein n=1 Tax=Puccinia coronata f. sp. avenae TaxID=200324 RepID=A0A2N5UJ96_9BASI|nr:hypothetical protein PCANC_21687 [Puccinia coronata f. sp. avenae]